MTAVGVFVKGLLHLPRRAAASAPSPPRAGGVYHWTVTHLDRMSVGNGVDQRIEVKSWEIRIFCFNENDVWSVIPATQDELEHPRQPSSPSLPSPLAAPALTRSGGHGGAGYCTGRGKRFCTLS